MGMSRPAVESTLFRARRRLTEEYDDIVSGARCQRIQRIIVTAAESRLGTRDTRRLARHLSHCQPCRREALAAGLDRGLFARPSVRERVAAQVAAFLPFPRSSSFRRGADAPPPPAGRAHGLAGVAPAAVLRAALERLGQGRRGRRPARRGRRRRCRCAAGRDAARAAGRGARSRSPVKAARSSPSQPAAPGAGGRLHRHRPRRGSAPTAAKSGGAQRRDRSRGRRAPTRRPPPTGPRRAAAGRRRPSRARGAAARAPRGPGEGRRAGDEAPAVAGAGRPPASRSSRPATPSSRPPTPSTDTVQQTTERRRRRDRRGHRHRRHTPAGHRPGGRDGRPVTDAVDDRPSAGHGRPEPDVTDVTGHGHRNGILGPAARLLALGAWRSLVARAVRVGEVPGSNPGAPMSREPRVSAALGLQLRQRRTATVDDVGQAADRADQRPRAAVLAAGDLVEEGADDERAGPGRRSRSRAGRSSPSARRGPGRRCPGASRCGGRRRRRRPSTAMIPKETAPWPTLPPIAKAPNIRAPRNRQNNGMHQRLRQISRVCMEHLFYGRVEVSGERDRQRERRRVALFFDRVDRLARDVHRLGELLLRQRVRRAEVSHLVLHEHSAAVDCAQ